MSVTDAALNVAEDFPGGASALARAIDKNHWSFIHELNGTGTAKLGLHTAVKMTLRAKDLRILQAFASECGQMCIPLPGSLDYGTDECMLAVGAMVRESGDVCQEICKSLGEDGVITDTELDRIKRECGELVAATNKLLSAAIARNARNQQQAQVSK